MQSVKVYSIMPNDIEFKVFSKIPTRTDKDLDIVPNTKVIIRGYNTQIKLMLAEYRTNIQETEVDKDLWDKIVENRKGDRLLIDGYIFVAKNLLEAKNKIKDNPFRPLGYPLRDDILANKVNYMNGFISKSSR